MVEVVEASVVCGVCGEEDDTAIRANPVAAQGKLNKEEVRSHHLIHQPYRSWCTWFPTGKAQDVRHKVERELRECQVASVERTYLAGNRECTNPLLVGHCDHTKCIAAWMVPAKGNAMGASQRLVQRLNGMGNGRVRFKCDQLFATIHSQNAVKIEKG